MRRIIVTGATRIDRRVATLLAFGMRNIGCIDGPTELVKVHAKPPRKRAQWKNETNTRGRNR